MKIRLQRGVILNDKQGKRLGSGNSAEERDIEVDEELGQQLIAGGSADLLEELRDTNRA